MSSNPYYDIIEDEIIGLLEKNALPQEPVRIMLAPDEMGALVSSGLRIPGSNENLPDTITRLKLEIASCMVLIVSETDPEDWVLH